jgi:hypothetical protein
VRNRIAPLVAVLAIVALPVAGCGGDDPSDQQAPPPARAQDFPKPKDQTIQQLLASLGSGPVLAPSGAEFRTGDQRVGFALFRRDRSQITNASVALYVAAAGGGPVKGPYLARYEDLSVTPQFQSRQTATDPDAAKSIYTAKIPFAKPGRYEMLGIAKQGGKLVAATLPQAGIVVKKAAADDPIPAVGTEPPRIHTPTITEVGGNAAAIDTRLPPDSMHDVDFADVLGKKPAVLLFATPQLCQSRVCGPVVDLAEQVKANADNSDVAFIHMEVFRDNRIDKGIRPQMAAFQLQTEPWLFTFDRAGKVAARIEGAFSERELDEAIAKARSG